MPGWRHRICGPCWSKQHSGLRPVRVIDNAPGRCCWCRESDHGAGIFLRADPAETACGDACDA